MKHRISLLLALLGLALVAPAQQRPLAMRDLWASMPAGLVPLLTENNRLDMIDFADCRMEARVRNVLDGFSTLDTLTADYLHCTLTAKTTLEMRLLPTADTTLVVAMLHTSRTPAPVSTLRLYTTGWRELPHQSFGDPAHIPGDTVWTALVRDHAELADLPLVGMRLSPDATTLTLTLTLSAMHLPRDERKALEGNLQPITLHWNEKTRSFAADAALR